jgi:chromosome segregation ATPase
MNRGLHLFNLAGVLALAVLCGVQWQSNRAVNLQVQALERTRQQQAARLKEHDQTIAGQAADLDRFRKEVTSAQAAVRQTEERSTASAQAVAQVTTERDQLKTSVAEWARAVTGREEQLQVLGTQLREVAAERNQVVTRFNELGDKLNEVVKTLNQRTRQCNELAERYQKIQAQGQAQAQGPRGSAPSKE